MEIVYRQPAEGAYNGHAHVTFDDKGQVTKLYCFPGDIMLFPRDLTSWRHTESGPFIEPLDPQKVFAHIMRKGWTTQDTVPDVVLSAFVGDKEGELSVGGHDDLKEAIKALLVCGNPCTKIRITAKVACEVADSWGYKPTCVPDNQVDKWIYEYIMMSGRSQLIVRLNSDCKVILPGEVPYFMLSCDKGVFPPVYWISDVRGKK